MRPDVSGTCGIFGDWTIGNETVFEFRPYALPDAIEWISFFVLLGAEREL